MGAERVVSSLIGDGIAEEAKPQGEFVLSARIGRTEVSVAGSLSAASAGAKLRSRWKRRVGNTPLKLLLLADVSGGDDRVVVVGPSKAEQGPYSVPATGLLEKLREFAGRPDKGARLRWLTRELQRLGLSGIPGVLVRGLLTEHTLERWRERDEWEGAKRTTAAIGPEDTWRPLLGKLGYELEQQPEGYYLRVGAAPVAAVIAFRESDEFDRFDENNRPPEGRLADLCASANLRYGLLAARGRLRLFRFDALDGSGAADWIELDAAELRDRDRPFLALFSADSLAGRRFENVLGDSRRYGTKLRKRLDQDIRDQVLPALAQEMEVWAKETGLDLSDSKVREDLEQASLTLAFRLLFLLYAESAGFLPIHDPDYRRASLTELVREAHEKRSRLALHSRALWDGFVRLVRAMRRGNPAWRVPAYNGALFSSEDFLGAEILERLSLRDPGFGDILVFLGWDAEHRCGVDYSTIEIGHLGHIYESLLTRRLTLAPRDVVYDAKKDRYRPRKFGEDSKSVVPGGSLLWQTHLGGRKAGGVYYTPSALVRHLVEQAVAPAFERHLARVRKTAENDPDRAAEQLLDFAVLDPACGSAHFLVEVLDRIGDLTARFLGSQPLPALAERMETLRAAAGGGGEIRDMALLRRLLLKHCIYGVDVSPMGVEIATLSLWLAAFVPGLSLSYLGRNVVVGNSLIGVADPESVITPNTFEAVELRNALSTAAEAAAELADNPDRTPEEYEQSSAADRTVHVVTQGMKRLFDFWTADVMVAGSRGFIAGRGRDVLKANLDKDGVRKAAAAEEAADRLSALHWPLVFPRVFAQDRPGFDVIVGNPPWKEVRVKKLSFYAMESPGIHGLGSTERERMVAELDEQPDLQRRLLAEMRRVSVQRRVLDSGDYEASRGDRDLYKYFCQRYRSLLRPDGAFGVVLPRGILTAEGSEKFRRWLYERTTVVRLDTCENRRSWMFDSHPQYSVALVAARNAVPSADHIVKVVGTADSVEAWERQRRHPGARLAPLSSCFGSNYETPLVGSQEDVRLLERVREGAKFPYGSRDRWACFPVAELHESADKALWGTKAVAKAKQTRPLWKGASFGQYAPHGDPTLVCAYDEGVSQRRKRRRPGQGSLLGGRSERERVAAMCRELTQCRVVFRQVTNNTNSRTVLGCLVPEGVLLTDKAPYLAFLSGGATGKAACLAILNSLPFDWQARRFVDATLNYFILEGLVVPDLSDEDFHALAHAAARLSAVDDRFADFAKAAGVECGPIDGGERSRLRAEIDARVARAWELDENDLDLMFSDFTESAVQPDYRKAVRGRLRELNA